MKQIYVLKRKLLQWVIWGVALSQALLHAEAGYAEVAYEWVLEGVVMESSRLDKLYESFPEIVSDDDLAALLEMISQIYPAYDVQARFDGDRWVLLLSKYPVITEISVLSTQDDVSRLFLRRLDYYIGKVYTQISARRIEELVREILKNEGYHPRNIAISHALEQASVRVLVSLELTDLCYIHRVQSDFLLPLSPDALLGKPCKKRFIDEFLQDVRDDFQDNSYIEHSVQAASLIYDESKEWGTVVIKGSPGLQVRYVFALKASSSSADKELSEHRDMIEDLRELVQPRLFSPYLALAEIKRLWREAGFQLVQVDEPVVEVDGEVKVYRFVMRPGEEVDIESMRIQGSKVLSEEEIYRTLSTKDYFWSWRRHVDLSLMDEKIADLEKKYRDQGYFDVAVKEPRIQKEDHSTASSLILDIDEGFPHILGRLVFQGNKAFSQSELEEMSGLQLGEVLSQSAILELRRRIVDEYTRLGYLDLKVDILISKKGHEDTYLSELIFQLDEGKQYRFGDIFVYGLIITKKSFVERYITIESGQPYNPEGVRETYQNLFHLNLFRSVKILTHNQQSTSEAAMVRDVVIVLLEADHGLIYYGPGYDIFNGFNYTFEGRYNNLWGLGQKVFGRVVVEEGKNQVVFMDRPLINSLFTLGYEYPDLWDYPVNFDVSLSRRTLATNYWQFTTTMVEDFEFYIPRYKETQMHVFFKQSERKEVGSEEQLTYFLSEAYVRTFSLGVRWKWDLRDNAIWPTSGWNGDTTYERAFYIFNYDTQFDKFDVYNGWYASVLDWLVYSFGLRWTVIWNIDRRGALYDGDNTLPITEMLLAGGSEYVRGFAEQLGPFVHYPVFSEGSSVFKEYRKDVIGGTERLIAKQRMRFLVAEGMAVNVFHDMGNSFLSEEIVRRFTLRFDRNRKGRYRSALYGNHSVKDVSQLFTIWRYLYSSAGLSFDYFTPIGSLKVSAAYPLYQPGRERCVRNVEYCLDRRNEPKKIIGRVKFDVSIAAKF